MTKVNDCAEIESATESLAKATIGRKEKGFRKATVSETLSHARQKNQTGKIGKVIVKQMKDGYRRRPNALVLVPTRELAIQIKDECEKLLKGTHIRSVALYKNPQ